MDDLATMTADLRRICETPAPTFDEGERALLLRELLSAHGLDPTIDVVGNVVAEVPGGTGPRLLVAAHLDTVFEAGTDVRVREAGDRWHAPGVGDNSSSLAVLVHLARVIAQGALHSRPRLTLAATVGEEGLGDLYGMRRLMEERVADWDAVVALDGHLGTVVSAAVGSRRFVLRFRAAGGHSWGDFPSPSATHALGDAISSLNRLRLPREPRSSYNVGQVWGGLSVNAIAEEAGFNLDLRSVDPLALEGLEREALLRIRRAAERNGVVVEEERVGERPAATVDNEALVLAACAALAEVGVQARTAASSTDANAAMAAGLPAVAFGVYRGGDAHRATEWMEPASLAVGYAAFSRFLLRLSRWGG